MTHQGDSSLNSISSIISLVQVIISPNDKPNHDHVLPITHITPPITPITLPTQHEACDHGYREIAERLLSYGAVVNAPGYDNNTPLHDAVRNNRLACVQLLVAHNADVHAR